MSETERRAGIEPTLDRPPPGAVDAPPPVTDEHVVVAESETLRERPDGGLDRDSVRLERRRRRPLDPAAIVGVVLLACLAAAGVAWWVVASGDDERTVPSVVGMNEVVAVAELRDEDFETTVDRLPDQAPPDTVVEQTPTAGSTVDSGSRVTLVVSAGPATEAVPNAVGLVEGEARDRLVAEGFEVVSRQVFAERPAGTVVSQSPPAGTQVDPGARVRLAVSKGTGLVDVPALVGMTRAEAVAELEGIALEANVVEVPSSEPAGTVVAQNPPAGRLRQGEAVRLNVSAGA